MYDFDKIVNRKNTNSVKYDLLNERFGSDDLIPMWVADMDFETPEFIINAIKSRLNHPVLAYSIRGNEFNESIKNWLKNRHNWEVDSSSISFSSGVVPGIVMSILALTNPKDEIIIQPPVYFPFFTSVQKNNRKLIENNLLLKNGRYYIDFKDLEQKAKSAKMLILCNPGNPTATAWTKEELRKIGEICLKNKVKIISDEIHSDLVFKNYKHIPLASISEEISNITITFMAPSKTFNIAGMSTAYTIIENSIMKKKYDAMMYNTHLFLGNVLGNHALIAAYNHGENWLNQAMDYIEENANYVINRLNSELPKVKVIPPEATFLLWIDFNMLEIKHQKIKDLLLNEAKLAFNDGLDFGKNADGFFRMNIAAPRKTIKVAVNRLINTFDKY
jgi:cystathionine beta-lyase